MILLPKSVQVYAAVEPVNLHKSFEGLSNLVRSVMRQDPVAGHVFLFLNRRRNQVKLLTFTRGGFTIVHKRLERGCFGFVTTDESGAVVVEMDADELAMLLEGIDSRAVKKSPRWQPESLALATPCQPV